MDWDALVEESLPMDLLALSSLGILDLSSIEQHLQSGRDINDTDHQKWTELMYACSFGHDETVKLLLSFGADCNVIDEKGRNALIIAVVNGLESSVECLIKLSDLNLLDNANRSALHYALELGLDDVICCLVQAGIDLNKPSHATPLMLAAQIGKLEFVKYLVKSGADYELPDLTGRKAEDIAKENGHVEISKFLKIISSSSINEILKGLGLDKYLSFFEAKSITYIDFLDMTEDDIKGIGISLIGPRRKLSLALQELRQVLSLKK